jgi:uncharacterized protein (TIGR01777 family)
LVSASAVGYYGSREFGVRVVCLRNGVVLGKGGALEKMLPPFKLGLGGNLADGRQWMPWIHIDDAVGLIEFAILSAQLRGPVNATAPDPVTNAEFTRDLAAALDRPAIFPVPKFALHLLFGEMAQIIYASQRVIPQAALRAGYHFRFPTLADALVDIVA